MRYFGRILTMIYVCTLSHTLNNVRFLLSHLIWEASHWYHCSSGIFPYPLFQPYKPLSLDKSKFLEATGMEHCNRFPTSTKVEAPLVTDENGSECNIYCPYSYVYVIGMMLYLASNKRPYISFAVHQSARFTHNTKASHYTDVSRIFWYIQGTKDNGLVCNPSKKLVVDCCADAYFSGLWGYENPQDPICTRSRTRFVVTFSNCPIWCV